MRVLSMHKVFLTSDIYCIYSRHSIISTASCNYSAFTVLSNDAITVPSFPADLLKNTLRTRCGWKYLGSGTSVLTKTVSKQPSQSKRPTITCMPMAILRDRLYIFCYHFCYHFTVLNDNNAPICHNLEWITTVAWTRKWNISLGILET